MIHSNEMKNENIIAEEMTIIPHIGVKPLFLVILFGIHFINDVGCNLRAFNLGNIATFGRSVTTIDKESDFRIKVDEKKIRCKVDQKFVSFAMATGLFNKSLHGLDFGLSKLRAMLKELSPAGKEQAFS